jgi:outer membrane biosynthesis protein TonB
MANAWQMNDPNFESRKNIRAGTYTALVCGGLLAIFMIRMWNDPPLPPPPIDEGIEVNLGNSDFGSGKDQPEEPGEPAPAKLAKYVPPAPVVQKEENAKDVVTDEKDEKAPVVKKPLVTKPKAEKLPDKEVVKKKPVQKPVVVDNPPPPVQRPKHLMPNNVGGNGTGGNEAASYKMGKNEGVAGGNGDQGRPGGNPDATNYTGGGRGNSGVRIQHGLEGRGIARAYSYKDEFNENATVAVDVKIDKAGNVISASFQLRGSTTSEDFYREKAVDIVKKSKFTATSAGPDEQAGTVLVSFKVRG